ncbi:MAG TPA: ABC transporter substrate-binding protein [Usitatibacter sp.]|nr:ABC transporter substrate-binding protein [Usitatibacter sp.]
MKSLRNALAALAAVLVTSTHAEQISVTHWGVQLYGLPFAVAMEKGFFKQAGIDIDGILTSKGGGTTVRNVLASGLPYGEVALSAAVAAAHEGIEIKIVNDGVTSVGDLLWVTTKDSPVKSIQDLAGKKMGYSSPKSVTDIVSRMCLEAQKVPLDKVQRVAVGGIGSQLTALKDGGIAAGYMSEPVWSKVKNDYRAVFYVHDVLPTDKITQTVGIVTAEFAKQHPDKVRAIVEGRRKGVQFIYSNPKEAADILAKAYSQDPKIMEEAVANMVKIRYWSEGPFDVDGMKRMVDGMVQVGALDKPFDVTKLIDRSFLK